MFPLHKPVQCFKSELTEKYIFFSFSKPKLSFRLLNCCGFPAAAWGRATGSGAVGLDCTESILIQTLVVGSVYVIQESGRVILAGSWVHSRAVLLKLFP